MTGSLYIVATPIGNLEDMTLRAIRILKEVDLIAAEDTRHTRKLLNHFTIRTELVSYYREKESQKSVELIEQMKNGTNVALVSDAGTPGISDPGSILIRNARLHDIAIIPIPGPSALSAAVSCAGLDPGSFLFVGFPPVKQKERRSLLLSFVSSPYPLVFYVSPHRIQTFIADAHQIFGDRTALWAREISKLYEEITETSLGRLAIDIKNAKIRGELVVIIHPGEEIAVEGETVEEILQWYRDNSQLSLKDVCRRVSDDLGVSRSETYQMALKLWKKK